MHSSAFPFFFPFPSLFYVPFTWKGKKGIVINKTSLHSIGVSLSFVFN